MDSQLVELVKSLCLAWKPPKDAPAGQTMTALDFPLDSVEISSNNKILFPILSGVSNESARIRFELLRGFNKAIQDVLSYFDLGFTDDSECLAGTFFQVRSLLFLDVKLRFMESILRKTNVNRDDAKEMYIDRMQSIRAQEEGKTDGMDSMFGQAFTELGSVDPSLFMNADNQPLKIKFKTEEGVDIGGPYREFITTVARELHTENVPLFILCPNGSANHGRNRDKYIVNPASKSERHLAMYTFLGKMIGLSIRSKLIFELNFSSIFWKSIVGEKLDKGDLEGIDAFGSQFLDEIRFAESKGITKDNFTDVFAYNWTTLLSDGTLVELKPNGKDRQVTFEEREEYIAAILQARMDECKVQMNAVREGLGYVVPLDLLKIFNWHQLETRIVGTPDFSIDQIKSNARYDDYNADDPIVGWFWNVMSSLSANEKSMFLRFCWGQSRLPDPSKAKQFVLVRLHREHPDASLPQAATCFFTLKMPNYSSERILREKFLYAITNCFAIDNA